MNIFKQLSDKSWITPGIVDDVDTGGAITSPPAKIGLWFFLAVVSSLFALFISAYIMRMALADWRPLTEPGLLWVNTGVLILSSVAMQWARVAARRGQLAGVQFGMAAGGIASFAFLAGQYLVWRHLIADGYFARSNPSYAFFYLITGLHAIHLLGGLWVWGKTTARLWRSVAAEHADLIEVDKVRLSVELCAVYWHYLLLVWLVLFGLLLLT